MVDRMSRCDVDNILLRTIFQNEIGILDPIVLSDTRSLRSVVIARYIGLWQSFLERPIDILGEQPVVIEAPVVEEEQPVVIEVPIVVEQPVVIEVPIVVEQPVVIEAPVVEEEQPVVIEAPVVEEEQPVVIEAPVVEEEQPVVEQVFQSEEEQKGDAPEVRSSFSVIEKSYRFQFRNPHYDASGVLDHNQYLPDLQNHHRKFNPVMDELRQNSSNIGARSAARVRGVEDIDIRRQARIHEDIRRGNNGNNND